MSENPQQIFIWITRKLEQRFSAHRTTSFKACVSNLFFSVILCDPSQRPKLYGHSAEHKSVQRENLFGILCPLCRNLTLDLVDRNFHVIAIEKTFRINKFYCMAFRSEEIFRTFFYALAVWQRQWLYGVQQEYNI